jgi:hypothetical protein
MQEGSLCPIEQASLGGLDHDVVLPSGTMVHNAVRKELKESTT